jgi:hypothetical protein
MLLTGLVAGAQEPVETGVTAPETTQMFEKMRYFKVTGKAKGADCAGAWAAAKAEIDAQLGKKDVPVLLGVWDEDRKDFAPVDAVTCTYKGKPDAPKASMVKVAALALKPGATQAFPEISGARQLEMMDHVLGDPTMMVSLQLQATSVHEYRGGLYFQQSSEPRAETFDVKTKRNDRAVMILREDLHKELKYWTERMAAMPEFTGVYLKVSSKRYTKDGGIQTEAFAYLFPNTPLIAYLNGELTEQQLFDNGAVMYRDADGDQFVKIDISVLAAREE